MSTPQMPRPPSDNPASETIRLRVTPKDKAKLQRLAKRAGLTLSAYLLACGLQTTRTE